MRRLALTVLSSTALLASLASPSVAQDDPNALDALVAKALPSVVRIYGGGFTNGPAYGSGVLVDERGFVLTTWSISLRTDTLKVVDHAGRRYAAVIWRADPGLGAALLKVQGTGAGFSALPLGDSSTLAPGDPVISFGNPFGFLYGTERAAASRGVVSAISPAGRGGFRLERFPPTLDTLLLTDIPNNPGTQGGPLLSLSGELVGIQGRLVESRATNTILNYALPANSVRQFVRAGTASPVARPELDPPPRKVRLGIVDVGLRLQRAHLVRSPLAYVERVVKESPAHRAGFHVDDLVFRIADRTIRSCRDWDAALKTIKRGADATVMVKRGNVMIPLTLAIPKEKGQ